MYILGPSPFDNRITESFILFISPNLPRALIIHTDHVQIQDL